MNCLAYSITPQDLDETVWTRLKYHRRDATIANPRAANPSGQWSRTNPPMDIRSMIYTRTVMCELSVCTGQTFLL
jgi:hypothetical protein